VRKKATKNQTKGALMGTTHVLLFNAVVIPWQAQFIRESVCRKEKKTITTTKRNKQTKRQGTRTTAWLTATSMK
jgi:hypothetical protein